MPKSPFAITLAITLVSNLVTSQSDFDHCMVLHVYLLFLVIYNLISTHKGSPKIEIRAQVIKSGHMLIDNSTNLPQGNHHIFKVAFISSKFFYSTSSFLLYFQSEYQKEKNTMMVLPNIHFIHW